MSKMFQGKAPGFETMSPQIALNAGWKLCKQILPAAPTEKHEKMIMEIGLSLQPYGDETHF